MSRAELVVASVLFLFACIQVFSPTLGSETRALHHNWRALLFFIVLAAGYFGPSVGAMNASVRSLLPRPTARLAAGPTILLVASILYARAEQLSVERVAIGYAAFLYAPVALLRVRARAPEPAPLQVAAAAAALWLPIEFHLLPALQVAAPQGFNAVRLIAIVTAFYLFLIGRPLSGIGYTFLLDRRDLKLACATLGSYAVVALPLGLATGFLMWHPRVTTGTLLSAPILIYLMTAVPEEFLFRGLIQNVLQRSLGRRAGLAVAAVVFGLAHLPNPSYVALATLAGVAYGWVYSRTGKITASAVTHAGVDWLWILLLRQ